jgi:hypothetical protein
MSATRRATEKRRAAAWRGLLLCAALLAAAAGGCASGGALHKDQDALARRLLVAPEELWRSGPVEALAKVRETPHGYYRFINAPFTRLVCELFAEEAAEAPRVNLHGDAHLEQYAVTDVGYGLVDFDSASRGPAIVDLMRFAVSIHLAARQRGWEAQVDSLVGRFLGGYRAALVKPDVVWPEARAVARVRAALAVDRASALARAEGWMAPLPAVDQPPSLEAYARAMRTLHPVGEAFFTVKRVGVLRLGVGSALVRKYLFRVEGPTPAEDDDRILEAKQVGVPADIGCLDQAQAASQVLLTNELLGRPPFRFSGTVAEGGATFWVFEWADVYVELDIAKSYRSAAELAEVVADAGAQLGAAHPLLRGEAPDPEKRDRVRLAMERIVPRLHRVAHRLAGAVVQAWRAFGSPPAGGAAAGAPRP